MSDLVFEHLEARHTADPQNYAKLTAEKYALVRPGSPQPVAPHTVPGCRRHNINMNGLRNYMSVKMRKSQAKGAAAGGKKTVKQTSVSQLRVFVLCAPAVTW